MLLITGHSVMRISFTLFLFTLSTLIAPFLAIAESCFWKKGKKKKSEKPQYATCSSDQAKEPVISSGFCKSPKTKLKENKCRTEVVF